MNKRLVEVLSVLVTFFLAYLIVLYFPYHILPYNTTPSIDVTLEQAHEIRLAEIAQAQKDSDATLLIILKFTWVVVLGITVVALIEIFRQ